MKIILVATDARGKNLVFVTDTLRVYSLQDALQLAKDGKLENAYPVQGSAGAYLRTKPHTDKKEHLDQLSISSYQLFSSLDNINYALTTPAFANYWRLYQGSLVQDQPLIVIEGKPRITKEAAREKLQPHRDLIFAAAKRFNVDPYLLGAIIIDEIARFRVIEPITDSLLGYFIGVNTSVGIAQVKIDTARDLIQSGYYSPNPDDPQLSKGKISKTSRSHLYTYVVQPEHSISFAVAKMRSLIDAWQKYIDISKSPDIIATLYSLKGKTPHARPQPNDRGLQIANEFYKLAREWLRPI
jgi:hypothetical protein